MLIKGNDGFYYLAIYARGFLLLVNSNTKEIGQYMFPENYLEYTFGSMVSKAGKVYLGAGTWFNIITKFRYIKREVDIFCKEN